MKLNVIITEEKKESYNAGKIDGIMKTLCDLVIDGILSVPQAAQKAMISTDEFTNYLNKKQKNNNA